MNHQAPLSIAFMSSQLVTLSVSNPARTKQGGLLRVATPNGQVYAISVTYS